MVRYERDGYSDEQSVKKYVLIRKGVRHEYVSTRKITIVPGQDGPEVLLDNVQITREGKGVAFIKCFTNIHGQSYCNMSFSPLELIGVKSLEEAENIAARLDQVLRTEFGKIDSDDVKELT